MLRFLGMLLGIWFLVTGVVTIGGTVFRLIA
jgi:uncharacterized membrane protein